MGVNHKRLMLSGPRVPPCIQVPEKGALVEQSLARLAPTRPLEM